MRAPFYLSLFLYVDESIRRPGEGADVVGGRTAAAADDARPFGDPSSPFRFKVDPFTCPYPAFHIEDFSRIRIDDGGLLRRLAEDAEERRHMLRRDTVDTDGGDSIRCVEPCGRLREGAAVGEMLPVAAGEADPG